MDTCCIFKAMCTGRTTLSTCSFHRNFSAKGTAGLTGCFVETISVFKNQAHMQKSLPPGAVHQHELLVRFSFSLLLGNGLLRWT